MAKFMRVISKITNVMVRVYFIILMARNLKAFGEMVKSMVKLFIYGLTVLDTMYSISMERNKEKECLRGLMSVWNN